MDSWTDDEFERVASTTRISARTLEACRDVLVHGIPGTEVASKHQMFQAQISRALTTLREARFGQVDQILMDNPSLARHMAVEIAKGVLGPAVSVSPAEPGKSYAGKVVVSTVGYVVQKVGRSAVLHDKSALAVVPEQGAAVEISYGPDKTGAASVNEVQAPAREQSTGLDR